MNGERTGLGFQKCTTNATYPCSFVTQIFRNCSPVHADTFKTFKVMTSTEPSGTLGSVASSEASIKEIIIWTTSSVISGQLRDVYTPYPGLCAAGM